MEEFLVHASPTEPDRFPFIVLGNKIDLFLSAEDSQESTHLLCCQETAAWIHSKSNSILATVVPKVSEQEALEWCIAHGNIPHVLVSAKNKTNLDRAFTILVDNVLQRLPFHF